MKFLATLFALVVIIGAVEASHHSHHSTPAVTTAAASGSGSGSSSASSEASGSGEDANEAPTADENFAQFANFTDVVADDMGGSLQCSIFGKLEKLEQVKAYLNSLLIDYPVDKSDFTEGSKEPEIRYIPIRILKPASHKIGLLGAILSFF